MLFIVSENSYEILRENKDYTIKNNIIYINDIQIYKRYIDNIILFRDKLVIMTFNSDKIKEYQERLSKILTR